jgi:hypothetical protein
MMDYDPADFAGFQQLYQSVSKIPEDVTPDRDFWAAMERYAPLSLNPGPRVRVLLSVAVSASGEVENVRAVEPALPPEVHAIAIHLDDTGTVIGEGAPVTDNPELIAAAEAIGRALRFRPAEKDGVPVAFPDYRMSIEFGGAGGAEASL